MHSLINNLYEWSSQKRLYDGFEHVEDISIFTLDVIINYDENDNFGYTLVFDVDYPEYIQP